MRFNLKPYFLKQRSTDTLHARPVLRLVGPLAFLLLFLGIGRLLNVALYDPVIAYGNNYDMVRIQACHQIWGPGSTPATVTQGHPQAPLGDYTLDIRIQTPCMPSAELLFTWPGIKMAQLAQSLDGSPTLAIQWIGLVKALALCALAIALQCFFYRQRQHAAQLSHGLLFLVVLSDPGISLYLNTFYTEFSAAFFLYAVLGLATVCVMRSGQDKMALCALCLALVGLGLSKTQHLPLTLLLGLLLSACAWCQWSSHKAAGLLFLSALLPALLQSNPWLSPRNDTMSLANKLDFMATQITYAKHKKIFIEKMGLPAHCIQLNKKNWYHADIQQQQICFALSERSHSQLILLSAVHNPDGWLRMIKHNIPKLAHWVYYLYGHIENRVYGTVDTYHANITPALKKIPKNIFTSLFLFPALYALWVIANIYRHSKCSSVVPLSSSHFTALLGIVAWTVFMIALCGDGEVDLEKHAHLSLPTGLAFYIVLVMHTLMKHMAPLARQTPG